MILFTSPALCLTNFQVKLLIGSLCHYKNDVCNFYQKFFFYLLMNISDARLEFYFGDKKYFTQILKLACPKQITFLQENIGKSFPDFH